MIPEFLVATFEILRRPAVGSGGRTRPVAEFDR